MSKEQFFGIHYIWNGKEWVEDKENEKRMEM
jgi:hypothetical protein